MFSLTMLSVRALAGDSLDMVRAGAGLSLSGEEARPPNCGDPASLRGFKGLLMGRLLGTSVAGVKTAGDWARCLCGKAADDAGPAETPPNPERVPAHSACGGGMTRETCARRDAGEYFKANLPVSDEQALRLGRCLWGLEPVAPPAAAPSTASVPPPAVEWVSLPGGRFTMGSDRECESPPREVTVKPFRIARTEVTVAQYAACVRARACTPPSVRYGGGWCNYGRAGRENFPVNCVSWTQAGEFSKWVKGRLPSAAEWEYAARSGGKPRRYPWGDEEPSCARAVIQQGGRGSNVLGPRGCGRKDSWPVCSKPSGDTEQGLCDMIGGVYEWLQDRPNCRFEKAPVDGSAWEEYDSVIADHASAVDNTRYISGPLRAKRGGAWSFGSYYASAMRDGEGREDQPGGEGDGFRPVQDGQSR